MTKDDFLENPTIPIILLATTWAFESSSFFSSRFFKILFIYFAISVAITINKIWISKVELYPRELAFAIGS